MLLTIPSGNRRFVNIVLNDYTVVKLSERGIQPRSFVITSNSLSISIRKKIQETIPESVICIDRNLRNVTISTKDGSIMYKTASCCQSKKILHMSFHHSNDMMLE